MDHRRAQQLVAIAGRLYERRDFCKLLWAEEYSEKIRTFRTAVRNQRRQGESELDVALRLSRIAEEVAKSKGKDPTLLVAAFFAAALDEIEGVAA